MGRKHSPHMFMQSHPSQLLDFTQPHVPLQSLNLAHICIKYVPLFEAVTTLLHPNQNVVTGLQRVTRVTLT